MNNVNQNIFKKEENWDITILGSWDFFRKQKLLYPNCQDLYKHQVEEVLKNSSEEIRKCFNLE